jgi:hypothetical protein
VVSIRAGYGEGLRRLRETTDHTRSRLACAHFKRTDSARSRGRPQGRRGVHGLTFNFASRARGFTGGGAQITIEVYGYDFDQPGTTAFRYRKPLRTYPLKEQNKPREVYPDSYRSQPEKAPKWAVNASYVAIS